MDYFNDVLTTFLGLEYFSCVAVYGGLESFWILSNYLNLCSEDERRSYGLARHEDIHEYLMTEFSFFLVNYPFKDNNTFHVF